MGFDVWVARSTAAKIERLHPAQSRHEANAPAVAPVRAAVGAQVGAEAGTKSDARCGRIQVGPGRGSTLLVCASAAESASKFAADVVRAVGGDPPWAWPVGGGGGGVGGDSFTLEEAIGARLITRVFVFGGDAGGRLFTSGIPPVVGTATVTPLAALEEISLQGAAKRALWRCLRDPLRCEPSVASDAPAA
jgi:hypothetical protein